MTVELLLPQRPLSSVWYRIQSCKVSTASEISRASHVPVRRPQLIHTRKLELSATNLVLRKAGNRVHYDPYLNGVQVYLMVVGGMDPLHWDHAENQRHDYAVIRRPARRSLCLTLIPYAIFVSRQGLPPALSDIHHNREGSASRSSEMQALGKGFGYHYARYGKGTRGTDTTSAIADFE